jgi:hypothetical protein
LNYGGLGYDSIWKGNRPDDAPLLTIYRHFDSASVHKGALGNLPKTLWVIDYPLLERIYYALVAGFDIYGNAGHQLAVRLYMDALRVEGESYFLDFLPQEKRLAIMKSWYLNADLDKQNYYPSALPAGIAFSSDDPKREFVETVVSKHLNRDTGIGFDTVNYLQRGIDYPMMPKQYISHNDFLGAFKSLSRPGTPFVTLVNDFNANLAYVRIRTRDANDIVFTMVGNRWHDNVAFLIDEDERLDPTKDSIDFIRGMIGSYPNYFFDVNEDDLPDFIDLLANFDKSHDSLKRLSKFGINRADDRFWETYDWFQKSFDQDEPVRGGLFDLNRYFHKAN